MTSLGAYVSLVVNTGDDKALFVMARFFLGRGRGDLVLRKKRLLGDVIFGFFWDLLRDVMIDEDFADVADAIFFNFWRLCGPGLELDAPLFLHIGLKYLYLLNLSVTSCLMPMPFLCVASWRLGYGCN